MAAGREPRGVESRPSPDPAAQAAAASPARAAAHSTSAAADGMPISPTALPEHTQAASFKELKMEARRGSVGPGVGRSRVSDGKPRKCSVSAHGPPPASAIRSCSAPMGTCLQYGFGGRG